jgi:phosphopantetheine adenylyltransferase
LLLFPSTKTQFVSSSSIKELLAFNVDIRKYVPDTVADEILKKFKSENNLK